MKLQSSSEPSACWPLLLKCPCQRTLRTDLLWKDEKEAEEEEEEEKEEEEEEEEKKKEEEEKEKKEEEEEESGSDDEDPDGNTIYHYINTYDDDDVKDVNDGVDSKLVKKATIRTVSRFPFKRCFTLLKPVEHEPLP